jgi:hypothetical protein
MHSDHAQGYLLGRPVEHAQLERRLDDDPARMRSTATMPVQSMPTIERMATTTGGAR